MWPLLVQHELVVHQAPTVAQELEVEVRGIGMKAAESIVRCTKHTPIRLETVIVQMLMKCRD